MLLEQKYKPKKIEEMILLNRIKEQIDKFINEDNDIPNLLFTGSFGLGKTLLSKLLAERFSEEILFINGSLDRKIDNVRNDVMGFLQTIPLGDIKIVIIDEFEMYSPEAQKSLKTVMNDYKDTTRFILTSNDQNLIDEAIMSRVITIEFNPKNENEEKELRKKIALKIKEMLDSEGINTLTDKERRFISKIIDTFFPDIRKTFEILSAVVNNGKITVNESYLIDNRFEDYFKLLKKSFPQIKKRLMYFNAYEAKSFSNFLFKEYPKVIDKSKEQRYLEILSENLNFWYSTFNKNLLLIGLMSKLKKEKLI